MNEEIIMPGERKEEPEVKSRFNSEHKIFRYIGLFLFVTLPFAGFWLGVQYGVGVGNQTAVVKDDPYAGIGSIYAQVADMKLQVNGDGSLKLIYPNGDEEVAGSIIEGIELLNRDRINRPERFVQERFEPVFRVSSLGIEISYNHDYEYIVEEDSLSLVASPRQATSGSAIMISKQAGVSGDVESEINKFLEDGLLNEKERETIDIGGKNFVRLKVGIPTGELPQDISTYYFALVGTDLYTIKYDEVEPEKTEKLDEIIKTIKFI